MTSNERKIINFLREAKDKAHISLIAKKTNFSGEYARSLCYSLARADYITVEGSNIYCLSKKGQGHLDNAVATEEPPKPIVASANVTLLTDDQPVKDEELDKALADLNSVPKTNEGEKMDKTEEPNETEPQMAAESSKIEIKEEKRAESQETVTTEVRPAENLTSTAPLESPEKAISKEESVKPSVGFGASFKKIANWFAEKK